MRPTSRSCTSWSRPTRRPRRCWRGSTVATSRLSRCVPQRLLELAPLLPAQLAHVAESGVATAQDAHAVAVAGYQFALVGSALMRAADPFTLAGALLAAGRAVRGQA